MITAACHAAQNFNAHGAGACPKCQRQRRGSEKACAQCGLLVSRWLSFRGEVSSHPVLDPLWVKLSSDWLNPSAHDQFLDAARVSGSLAIAAALYRKACLDSSRRVEAQAGLKRSLLLAERLLAVAADNCPSKPSSERSVKIVRGFCAIMMCLAGFGVFTLTLRSMASRPAAAVAQQVEPARAELLPQVAYASVTR